MNFFLTNWFYDLTQQPSLNNLNTLLKRGCYDHASGQNLLGWGSYLIFVNFFTQPQFKAWKFFHLKVRKFAEKIASRQNSVKQHLVAQIHTYILQSITSTVQEKKETAGSSSLSLFVTIEPIRLATVTKCHLLHHMCKITRCV